MAKTGGINDAINSMIKEMKDMQKAVLKENPNIEVPVAGQADEESIKQAAKDLQKAANNENVEIPTTLGIDKDDVKKQVNKLQDAINNEKINIEVKPDVKGAGETIKAFVKDASKNAVIKPKVDLKSFEDLKATLTEMEDIYQKFQRPTREKRYNKYDEYGKKSYRDLISEMEFPEGWGDSEHIGETLEKEKQKLLEIFKLYKNVQSAIKNHNGWFKDQQFEENDLEQIATVFKTYAQDYHELVTEYNEAAMRMSGGMEELGMEPKLFEDLASVTSKMTKNFKEYVREVIEDSAAVKENNKLYDEEVQQIQLSNKALNERYALLRKNVVSLAKNKGEDEAYRIKDILPYVGEWNEEDYDIIQKWGAESFLGGETINVLQEVAKVLGIEIPKAIGETKDAAKKTEEVSSSTTQNIQGDIKKEESSIDELIEKYLELFEVKQKLNDLAQRYSTEEAYYPGTDTPDMEYLKKNGFVELIKQYYDKDKADDLLYSLEKDVKRFNKTEEKYVLESKQQDFLDNFKTKSFEEQLDFFDKIAKKTQRVAKQTRENFEMISSFKWAERGDIEFVLDDGSTKKASSIMDLGDTFRLYEEIRDKIKSINVVDTWVDYSRDSLDSQMMYFNEELASAMEPIVETIHKKLQEAFTLDDHMLSGYAKALEQWDRWEPFDGAYSDAIIANRDKIQQDLIETFGEMKNAPQELIETYKVLYDEVGENEVFPSLEQVIAKVNAKAKELGVTFDEQSKTWIKATEREVEATTQVGEAQEKLKLEDLSRDKLIKWIQELKKATVWYDEFQAKIANDEPYDEATYDEAVKKYNEYLDVLKQYKNLTVTLKDNTMYSLIDDLDAEDWDTTKSHFKDIVIEKKEEIASREDNIAVVNQEQQIVHEASKTAIKSIEEVRAELIKLLSSDEVSSEKIAELLGLDLDDVNSSFINFTFNGASNNQMADWYMALYKEKIEEINKEKEAHVENTATINKEAEAIKELDEVERKRLEKNLNQKVLDRINGKSGNWNVDFDNAQKEFDEIISKLEELDASTERAKNRFADWKDTHLFTSDTTKDVQKSSEAINKESESFEKVSKKAKKASDSKGKFTKENKKVGKEAKTSAENIKLEAASAEEAGEMIEDFTHKVQGYVRSQQGDVTTGNFSYVEAVSEVADIERVYEDGALASERLRVNYDKLTKKLIESDRDIIISAHEVAAAEGEEQERLQQNLDLKRQQRAIYQNLYDFMQDYDPFVISEEQQESFRAERDRLRTLAENEQIVLDIRRQRKQEEKDASFRTAKDVRYNNLYELEELLSSDIDLLNKFADEYDTVRKLLDATPNMNELKQVDILINNLTEDIKKESATLKEQRDFEDSVYSAMIRDKFDNDEAKYQEAVNAERAKGIEQEKAMEKRAQEIVKLYQDQAKAQKEVNKLRDLDAKDHDAYGSSYQDAKDAFSEIYGLIHNISDEEFTWITPAQWELIEKAGKEFKEAKANEKAYVNKQSASEEKAKEDAINAIYKEREDNLRAIYDLENDIAKLNSEKFKDSSKIIEKEEAIAKLKSKNEELENKVLGTISERVDKEKVLVELEKQLQHELEGTERTEAGGQLDKIMKDVPSYQKKIRSILLGKFTDEFKSRFSQRDETNILIGGFEKELDNIVDKIGKIDLSNLDTGEVKKLYSDFQNLKKIIDETLGEKGLAENKKAAQSSLAKLRKSVADIIDLNSNMGKKYENKFLDIEVRINDAESNADVEKLKAEIVDLNAEIIKLGKNGKSAFQEFREAVRTSTTQFLSTYFSWQDWIRYAREAFETIKDLDYALVDLRKTTSMSASELDGFYYNSNNLAKNLGVTTEEIINQASAWSRLGYTSKEEVETMSQLSSQFATISPGMDVETAQQGLVSIMKAYDKGVDEVKRDIMDNINILGNSFAESNEDIINGMERAAAALAVTGTDFEDALALFTGGQEVVQNAEKMGTALRSISLRIRGYNEESEELDEELTTITGDLADLTKTAAHPLGISIFKPGSTTEFKSLVDYLGEVSEIWDEMTDKQKNDFLQKAFAKTQAQSGAAIIQNFDQVKAALEKMKEAEGSADKEMEIASDSITFKLNALQQTWVGIFQRMLDRGDIGKLIDLLTNLSEVLGKLLDTFGLIPTTTVALIFRDLLVNFDKLEGRAESFLDFVDTIKNGFDKIKEIGSSIKLPMEDVFESYDVVEDRMAGWADALSDIPQVFKDGEIDEAIENIVDVMSDATEDFDEEVTESWSDTLEHVAEMYSGGEWGDEIEESFSETLERVANSDSWDNWGDEVEQSWADKLAEIANSDEWNRWGDEVEKNISDVAEEMVEPLSDVVESVDESIPDIITELTEIPDTISEFTEPIEDFSSVIIGSEEALEDLASGAEIAETGLVVFDETVDATGAAATATTFSVKGLATALKSLVVAHPVIAAIAILGTTAIAAKVAFDKFTISVAETKKSIADTETEISSLKSEIKELQDIDYRTDAEQNRLENLEKELEIKETILDLDKQILAQETFGSGDNVFEKWQNYYDSDNAFRKYNDAIRNRKGIDTRSILSTLLGEFGIVKPIEIPIDTLRSDVDLLKQYQEELNKVDGDLKDYEKASSRVSSQEIKVKESLQDLRIELADYQSEYEKVTTALESGDLIPGSEAYDNALKMKEGYEILIAEDKALIAETEKLLGIFDYSSTIDSIFEHVEFEGLKDELVNLAKEGGLSIDYLIQKFSEDGGLLAVLLEAGVDVETLYSYLVKLSGLVDRQNLTEKINKQIKHGSGVAGVSGYDYDQTRISSYINSLSEEDAKVVAGLDIDWTTFNADDAIKKMQSEVDKAHGNPVTAKVSTIVDSVEGISKRLKPQFDELGELYQSIFYGDDGKFSLEKVTNDQLKGITQAFLDAEDENGNKIGVAFEGAEEAVNEFINTLTSAETKSKSLAQQQQITQDAVNKLATQYFYAAGGLKELNGETKDAIEQQLKQLGIANSDDIVEYYSELAKGEKLATEYSIDLTNATADEITALVTEQGVAPATAQALAVLALQKRLAAGVNFNEASDIEQLEALAKAAGASAKYMSMLAEAKQYAAEVDMGNFIHMPDLKRLEKEIEAFNPEDVTINIEFDYPNGKDASGSGKEAADEWVEAYKKEKEQLQSERDAGLIDEKTYLEKLRALIDKFFKDRAKYAKNYIDEMKEYLDGMKSLYDSALSGISTILDKKINAANKGKDAAVKALNEEKEAAEEAIQAQIDAIDEELEALDKVIDKKNEEIDALQEQIDKIDKANEARERSINLQKAEYELQRAQNQRTSLVYTGGAGGNQMRYERDEHEVREKADDVKKSQEEIAKAKIQAQIDLIEKEIKAIEKQKKELTEQQKELQKQLEETSKYYDKLIKEQEKYWDALIEGLEKQKEKWESIAEIETIANAYSAITQVFGELGYTVEDVINGNEAAFEDFKSKYIQILQDMNSGKEPFLEGIDYATEQTRQNYGIIAKSAEETTIPIATLGEASQTTTGQVATLGTTADTASVGVGNLKTQSTGIAENIDALNKVSFEPLLNALAPLEETLMRIKNLLGGVGDPGDGSIAGVIAKLNTMKLEDLVNAFTELSGAISSVSTALGVSVSTSTDVPIGMKTGPYMMLDKTQETQNGTGLVSAIENVQEAANTHIGTKIEEGETAIGSFVAMQGSVDNVSKAIGEVGKDAETENGLALNPAIAEVQTTTDTALNGENGNGGAIEMFEKFKETLNNVLAVASLLLEVLQEIASIQLPEIGAGSTTVHNPGGSNIRTSGSGATHGGLAGNAYTGSTNISGKALVGELGRELLATPDGRVTTIGDNGAEFRNIPKNSVIFNHEDTEELLKKGKLNGRGSFTGRSFAQGTLLPHKFVKLTDDMSFAKLQAKIREYGVPTIDGIRAALQSQTDAIRTDLQSIANSNAVNTTVNQSNTFNISGVTGEDVARQINTTLVNTFQGMSLNAYQRSMT